MTLHLALIFDAVLLRPVTKRFAGFVHSHSCLQVSSLRKLDCDPLSSIARIVRFMVNIEYGNACSG